MMKSFQSFHKDAALYIGLRYKNGQGVEKDERIAFRYIKKSFYDFKSIEGAYFLAIMAYEGDYVPQSHEQAFKLFKYAADHKHPRAQYRLAEFYKNGIHVDVDHHKAFLLYKESSLNKEAEAFVELAACFLKGEGIFKDYNRALACFKYAYKLDETVFNKHVYSDDVWQMFKNYFDEKEQRRATMRNKYNIVEAS